MKSEAQPPRASRLVADFAADGRYHFTAAEMRTLLGVSPAAARLALSRLANKGQIASPARGFYVVLPPEYRRLGCLPAEQFVPSFMAHCDRRYYAALLSAAQFHGAAHHRPQTFQVALAEYRRPISCGRVAVSFITRRRLTDVPVESFNTPRGAIRVSSPEATAVDLVGYEKRVGGLAQAATVIAELAERIHPDRLAAAARTAPVSWAQRLGYLLDLIGAADKASSLQRDVLRRARGTVLLVPSSPNDGPLDRRWRLRINTEIEVET
jgi:predicted transcriptional regulator of viral defense system